MGGVTVELEDDYYVVRYSGLFIRRLEIHRVSNPELLRQKVEELISNELIDVIYTDKFPEYVEGKLDPEEAKRITVKAKKKRFWKFWRWYKKFMPRNVDCKMHGIWFVIIREFTNMEWPAIVLTKNFCLLGEPAHLYTLLVNLQFRNLRGLRRCARHFRIMDGKVTSYSTNLETLRTLKFVSDEFIEAANKRCKLASLMKASNALPWNKYQDVIYEEFKAICDEINQREERYVF